MSGLQFSKPKILQNLKPLQNTSLRTTDVYEKIDILRPLSSILSGNALVSIFTTYRIGIRINRGYRTDKPTDEVLKNGSEASHQFVGFEAE
jgi:hypothetical protein